MLEGHGDDSYRYDTEIVADFSTNIWDGAEPAGLKEHIFSAWKSVNRYPQVMGERVAEVIGQHHQLSGEHILMSSGSTESIYLCAQAFRQANTCIAVPAFAEYEDACCMHAHHVHFLNWEDLDQSLRLDEDLFFICNPNNPTGEVFFALEQLIERNPQTVFVIDEAFIEFTHAIASCMHLVRSHANVLILRSLTKAYAIPGLRLGYMAGDPQLIQKIKATKFPWSVNSLALEAGRFIFEAGEKPTIDLTGLLHRKADFLLGLEKTSLKPRKSYTHFFVAELGNRTASELKHFLIQNHGILIRDASNFRTLTKRHVRLATLSSEKNELLISALHEWDSLGS